MDGERCAKLRAVRGWVVQASLLASASMLPVCGAETEVAVRKTKKWCGNDRVVWGWENNARTGERCGNDTQKASLPTSYRSLITDHRT